MSKGQLVTVDAMFAIGFFLFLLISSSTLYEYGLSRYLETSDQKVVVERAQYAFYSLVYSPGFPLNWEDKAISSITQVGVLSGGSELNHTKLQALVALNSSYSALRERMGLRQDDFYLTVYPYNGSEFLLDSTFSVGRQNQTSRTVWSMSAIRSYNASLAKIVLQVYYE